MVSKKVEKRKLVNVGFFSPEANVSDWVLPGDHHYYSMLDAALSWEPP